MANYEKYWLKVWDQKRLFEADPVPGKKKAFVTFPYPYMQGPLHIGHCFTATRCDIYARFKRMQGYNVLFPWAWHWTGESIPGQSYRLSQGDKTVRRAFVEIDGVPESEVERFVDPEYLASYYTRVSKEAVKETGFSVDWRREFRTIDPAYKKFIEWQYLRLRELGYVVQGTHPVVWCKRDLSPTGDHDRLEGEGVSAEEFNLIKFTTAEGDRSLVAGTLRPETIFGATNVWVHPEASYSEAEVDGEIWIISSSAVERLREQQHLVEVRKEFEGKELLGTMVKAPVTGAVLPVLPARFVDADLVTGVVYSVPAHAPYDYMGLDDIKKGRLSVSSEIKAIADAIQPVSIITVAGYSDVPARDIVEKMKISDAADVRLDDATNELYKAEFHRGVMKTNCPPYAGLKVSEAKEKIVEEMKTTKSLALMYELPEKVVCKCGTRCYVKILENQWFLNYSDPAWKERTKQLIRRASVLPPESLEWYFSTIDWLRNWPCARRAGMGTTLPWDNEWIVETLSDSTIYMAFYTINQMINSERVKFDQLTPEVCDFIFLGKGSAAHLARATDIDIKVLNEMRASFLYWYPVDLRNSAKELIPNHLTFFAFHHAALFPESLWPRGFSVNGMIQIEGQKMSKSRGVFVTWRQALEKYGADALRATLALAADGMDDADWKSKNAEDLRVKIDSLFPFFERNMAEAVKRDPNHLDRWLISTIHQRIEETTLSLESMKIRRGLAVALNDIWNDIRWYLRREPEPRKQTLQLVFESWIRLLSPFMPFAAEELNKRNGGRGIISIADWPSPRDFPTDPVAETSELLVTRVLDDARNLLKVIKQCKSRLNVYVSSDDARNYFLELAVAERDHADRGAVIKKYAGSGIRPERIIKHRYELGEALVALLSATPEFDEYEVLKSAAEFISREIGLEVVVFKAGKGEIHDPTKKAGGALPFKPAFYLE